MQLGRTERRAVERVRRGMVSVFAALAVPRGKMLGRCGAPVAIMAMAAKLARLVYRMLCHGMKYVDKGATLYQAQHRHLQIKQLNWKAASLGYQLIPVPAA